MPMVMVHAIVENCWAFRPLPSVMPRALAAVSAAEHAVRLHQQESNSSRVFPEMHARLQRLLQQAFSNIIRISRVIIMNMRKDTTAAATATTNSLFLKEIKIEKGDIVSFELTYSR